MRRRSIILAALLAAFLATGLGCKGAPTEVLQASKPVTLAMWGVYDDIDAYQGIINDYRAAHPYVQIQYRKLRPEEYEEELVNALAEDRGPDIFLVHNDWVRAWQSRIEPMPPVVQLAELVTKGTVRKEQAYEIHQKQTLSIRALQTLFPDQVVKDAVLTVREQTGPTTAVDVQKIHGLPLSIDSLALYWNRDLLNAAGIPEPPATWTDFQTDVKKMVKLDASSAIVQAGAAIGTEKNIERPTDVLSLLMMQNGTQMTDDSGFPTFDRTPPNAGERELPPGWEATIFYTDFANPNKEVYTWNDSLPNALDAFVTGQSAMFLGYQYHLPLIRARAPKLKFGVAPAPQIPGGTQTNFANYWLYTVSKKTKNRDIAWDFLLTMTAEREAKKYLTATGKPTALRSLIQGQIEDVDVGVFAGQILTAQSWYHGYDTVAAERALRDLIDEVLAGGKIDELMYLAVQRVQQTMTPKR